MSDVKEVRRANLRRLVIEHEGMNTLARKLGMNKGAYISQLLSDPPIRPITEKTARKWERALGLPEYWFDAKNQFTQPTAPAATPPPAAANGKLLTEVVTQVLTELKVRGELTPAEVADLIEMVYQDSVAAGRVDVEKLKKLVALIKR